MKLLVKFPTRSRPEKFFDTFYKYQQLTSLVDTSFLISLDEDDRTMNDDVVKKALRLFTGNTNTTVVYGNSKNKIDACNRDVNEYKGKWDIILLASDDMIPIVQGYDEIIVKLMKETYPDGDGVLWFNDGYVGERLNTLCCMGRKYYERLNYIYNPEYTSLWCDNEFMDVANILGKQKYISQVIIRHEHPMNTGTRQDPMYVKNNGYYHQDEQVYFRRKKRNFDLNLIHA